MSKVKKVEIRLDDINDDIESALLAYHHNMIAYIADNYLSLQERQALDNANKERDRRAKLIKLYRRRAKAALSGN